MYVLRRAQWPALFAVVVGAVVATLMTVLPAKAATTDTLLPGQSIVVGQQLTSEAGQHTAGIGDGNLVVFRAGYGEVFRSGTQAVDAKAQLTLGTDGNVVLRDGAKKVRWQSGTAGSAATRLVLQGDGNLVLLDSASKPLWNSGSGAQLNIESQSLPSGGSLMSPDHSIVATMQRDGNLVLLKAGQPIWSSGTAGVPGAKAVVSSSVGLVVMSMSNTIVWSSRTPFNGAGELTVQDDGNLVIYADGKPVWDVLSPPAPPGMQSLADCKLVTGPVPVTDTAVASNGTRLHVCLLSSYEAMVRDAASQGVTLRGSGWRDNQRQIQLRIQNCGGNSYYNVYQKPSSQCSPPTAIPGRSMHERGLAVDFSTGSRSISSGDPQFSWLKRNAANYGFYNLPSESWHWSTNGG